MNCFTRNSLILSVVFVTQAPVQEASAQSDITGAAPNVLLLVDTSGSMEYMTSTTNQPNCDPTGNTPSDKSRWINLVEVLTGNISNYRCATVDRASSAFVNEYSLGGNRPADFGYSIPYHRPMSGNCIAGPGTINLTNNAFAVTDSVGGTRVGYRDYSNSSPCVFSQNTASGLLLTYTPNVRFGLMTFDTKTSAGTGYTGVAADFPSGIAGTWSYFVGNPAQGRPGGCPTLVEEELGARNAAAPPWEGRMVAFGDPAPNSNGSNDDPTTRAQWIQEILLTTRPFDGTPIAAMLDDARAFLWNDQSKDPLDPTGQKDFGPFEDPYLLGLCRKNFIILLTDGQPNLELRPECQQPGGVCPYDYSYNIARDLYNQAPPKQVETFVVGFAVSQVTVMVNGVSTPLDCRTLTATDVDSTNPGSLCSLNAGNAALQACCVLDQIAYNGGSSHAYFADNPTELSAALSSILSSLSQNTTSRTWPVMASSGSTSTGNGGVAGYRFYTSFRPRLSLTDAGLWSGVIERNRFVCTAPTGGGTPTAVLQPVDRSLGDEFADNVNSESGPSRYIYSFVGSNEAGKILSTGMLRPYLTTDDGAGVHTGSPTIKATADAFPAEVDPLAMNITDTTCASDSPPRLATACRDTRLGWLLGQSVTNGTNPTTTFTRCAQPGGSTCSLVADVYHSTPVIVNHPTDAPRDETYQAFAAAWSQRPLVLYTSTNDGFLHAFKVASNYTNTSTDSVTTLANNELWAFMPPAVLPDVVSEFPGTHLQLLDGAPVVANIVATPTGGAYRDTQPQFLFERTSAAFASATAGTVNATTWRTVLVQSFGKNRGGYFALDVTNPDTGNGNPYSASPANGPEFLWQLSEDSSNRWLFGPSGATPLITTLFFQPPNENSPREVAVAILPGGNADANPSGTVPRGNQSPAGIPSAYPVRANITAYTSNDAMAARSLTIVRLDTGEIMRTFRPSNTLASIPSGIQGRITVTPLDSPITGQPVAYPAIVGAIADRAYVGDRDGALWRVDLSSSNPANWSMNLFFDAYANQSPTAGQPIVTPPQLSIDDSGRVTIAFSTGSQDVFSANASTLNYVWSLTENINFTNTGATVGASVNWYRQFTGGECVVGPMQLFGSGLYFASYQPASGTAACNAGSSRIWGMNYNTLVDPILDAKIRPLLPPTGQIYRPKVGDLGSRQTEPRTPLRRSNP